MITNAKDRNLNSVNGSLPDMGEALLNWFQNLSFVRVTKGIVDFKLVETTEVIIFRGVRQPFSPQRLMMKPEGQRMWKWETIHAQPDLILKPDDIIIFDCIRYRVMAKSDFKEYGYVLYEIVEDYKP